MRSAQARRPQSREGCAAFAGKKGADAQKKKQELLAEAQKRFGSDPKTLTKVKAYIEAHSPKS